MSPTSLSSTEFVSFLRPYIDERGNVNYKKLKTNTDLIRAFDEIKTKNLFEFKSKREKFAFWINTYNILVIQGVLKKLEKNPSWKGTTSYISRVLFFVIQKFQIGSKNLSLYTIENKILRKEFKDPRVHFALNCASSSCPIIPSSLFTEESLENTLDQYTRNFINDENNVKFDTNLKFLYVSPIFKWYINDFKNQGGIIPFIKKFHNNFPKLDKNPIIVFYDYNWMLNKQ